MIKKKFEKLSFKSKYSFLAEFLNDIDISSDLKPRKKKYNKNNKGVRYSFRII